MSEYGSYHNNVEAVMAEVYARGPVTAGIAGLYLHNYTGGIIRDKKELRNLQITHEVQIVGWRIDESNGIKHWIIRNSHGEYWGELSFFRIEMGYNLLGVESHITWVTPGFFTIHNKPCISDGSNCRKKSNLEEYQNPLLSSDAYGRRALLDSSE